MPFSTKLLQNHEAKSPAALQRIALAKKRVLSILDREIVAHQKTLEQKIADQGPVAQRVDPHLLGLAIMDMIELNRLKKLSHPATNTKSWCANIGTPDDTIQARLAILAPLYASITGGGFGNLTGDALEVVTFKCLKNIYRNNPRFAYQGHFFLDKPKIKGRFQKQQPPKAVGGGITTQEADFIQFGHDVGPMCIECKNLREWFYPRDTIIKELIRKSYDLGAIPVIVSRRIHYTSRTKLFVPAGIIAHESYYQYYPSDKQDLATKVRDRHSLGFTDVVATETPHARTVKFFETLLPSVATSMATKWQQNRSALYDFSMEALNLSQLYTAIGSPAGGKWMEGSEEGPTTPEEY